MGTMRLGGVRVGVRHLSASVKSAIEGLIYLMQARQGMASDAAAEAVHVELFDRIAALDGHLREGEAAFRVYLRGFEPFVRAAQADLVLDRPIRPSALAGVFEYCSSRRPEAAQPSGHWVDANGLLEWLYRHRAAGVTHVRSDAAMAWWCIPRNQEVYGTPLAQLSASARSGALRYAIESQIAELPGAPGTRGSYEQWVYTLAQQSSGAALLEHDDTRALVLDRSIAVSANQREFARLSALFLRPLSVVSAARSARLPPATVRRFVNAGITLGRIHAAPATSVATPRPAPEPAATEAHKPTPGLFSRLLKRLVEGKH